MTVHCWPSRLVCGETQMASVGFCSSHRQLFESFPCLPTPDGTPPTPASHILCCCPQALLDDVDSINARLRVLHSQLEPEAKKAREERVALEAEEAAARAAAEAEAAAAAQAEAEAAAAAAEERRNLELAEAWTKLRLVPKFETATGM